LPFSWRIANTPCKSCLFHEVSKASKIVFIASSSEDLGL
jgi:hypothetical protein